MTSMFRYVDNNNARNCLRAYRQGDLQIPAGIHKMVFVNSFAYKLSKYLELNKFRSMKL